MVRRASWLALLGLTACTPLRPLEPTDAGSAMRDVASADAARADAPGLDAPGLDAPGLDAPGLDARAPDAFVVGADAVVASPDAFAPDAFAPPDGNCLPLGRERCGGGDEDCDGTIDEADAVDATTWYPDVDRDGYGADVGTVVACREPAGADPWTNRGGDCDDSDAQVRPGRAEHCNATDDDCDGLIDDGDPCPATSRCFTEVLGTHTYQFCDGRLAWTMAAATCAGWGYHLVHIDDLTENDFVTTTADMHGLGERTPFEHLVWIGAQRDAGGVFRLTDGTPLAYSRWAVGEPSADGECARIVSPAGRWADAMCSYAVDFVCETP